LAHSFGEAFGYTVSRKSAPVPGGVEKRFLGVERIRLDQHTVKIELAEQLFENRPLMVFAGCPATIR
jgi:hypothetical protein